MSQVFKRRVVREKVLQILYSYELNEDGLNVIKTELLADVNVSSDREFAIELINKVIENQEILDDEIRKRVTNWEMNRIALIDKILLRIGLCELLFFPDIPPKVSINEVIEIAKLYSTAGSGKFINGILDSSFSVYKKEGKLKKSGRGLVDETISKISDKNNYRDS